MCLRLFITRSLRCLGCRDCLDTYHLVMKELNDMQTSTCQHSSRLLLTTLCASLTNSNRNSLEINVMLPTGVKFTKEFYFMVLFFRQSAKFSSVNVACPCKNIFKAYAAGVGGN